MIELPGIEQSALAARILEEAGGEPLAAVEIIPALANAGELVADQAGSWRLVPQPERQPLPLPVRLRQTLEGRLEQLSPCASDVLSAAAVLGRASEPELLGALTGLSPAAVDDAAAELIAHGILVDGEFAHAALRPTAKRCSNKATASACTARQPQRSSAVAAMRQPARACDTIANAAVFAGPGSLLPA